MFVSGKEVQVTVAPTSAIYGAAPVQSLVKANFSGETASGWQTVTFTTPVAIAANTTYVASYFSPTGYYSSTNPYFSTATTNGYLTALANGTDGSNGVYLYTATGAFPINGFQSQNNWVDVVFTPNVTPDTTPPTISMTAPAAGNVSGIVNVSANASDNIGVVGVQFLLNGANLGAEVTTAPYTYSWNTTSVANGSYTLTARARDAAGNTTTSTGVVVTCKQRSGYAGSDGEHYSTCSRNGNGYY